MNCPNCGADLPEGSTVCSVCSTPINTAPAYEAAPAKKKAPVVPIVIAVVVVLAAVLIGYFVINGKHNGTYYLESMSYAGTTMSASDLGMTDVGIKVSFGRCEFVGGDELGLGDSGRSKIKFSDGTVTITDSDGTSISGDYDGDSFTLNASGVDMTFTK